jgi:hypothetical protein
MATFPTFSQTGGPSTWICYDGGITNHEVFTFTLQSAPIGVGATVLEAAVFQGINLIVHPGGDTVYLDDTLCYVVKLNVVDSNLNSSKGTVTGNFESTGI